MQPVRARPPAGRAVRALPRQRRAARLRPVVQVPDAAGERDHPRASFPVSLELGRGRCCSRSRVGVPLGVLAANRQNTGVRLRARWRSTLLGVSVPNFVLGPAARARVLAHAVTGCRPRCGMTPARAACCPCSRCRRSTSRTSRASRAAACSRRCGRTTSAPRAPRGCPSRAWSSGTRSSSASCRWCRYLGPAAARIVMGSIVVEQIFADPRARPAPRERGVQPRLHARARRSCCSTRASCMVLNLRRRRRLRVARSARGAGMSALARAGRRDAARTRRACGPTPGGACAATAWRSLAGWSCSRSRARACSRRGCPGSPDPNAPDFELGATPPVARALVRHRRARAATCWRA